MNQPALGTGLTALITGASSGIGEALAERFAKTGFQLVLVARQADKLQVLAQSLKASHGVKAWAAPADLSQPGAARALAAAQKRARRPIDVLVDCAGVLEHGSFTATPPRRHQDLIALNVGALTDLLAHFVPAMVARGHGRVLNVASIAAFQPVPQLATYAATKAYVLSLSESLAEELKGSGVTVTALCPGITATHMLSQAQRGSAGLQRLPGIVVGSVDDVADQGFAACMQGEVIRVPGALNRAAAVAGRATPKWLLRRVSGALVRGLRWGPRDHVCGVTSAPGAHPLARFEQRMQGDLAHLGLALFDVAAQQQQGRVGLALHDAAQDLGVLLVGGLDAVAAREVQPPHDADVFGGFPVHARHLGVAGGAHQRGMELLVELTHLAGFAQPFSGAHEPHALELFKRAGQLGAGAQARHAGRLQHHAQVVELLEAVEVDRAHEPAALALDFDQAFVAQTKQGFAHRRAADAQALRNVGLREAIAGDEQEVLQLLLERAVDMLGQQLAGLACGASGAADCAQAGPGLRLDAPACSCRSPLRPPDRCAWRRQRRSRASECCRTRGGPLAPRGGHVPDRMPCRPCCRARAWRAAWPWLTRPANVAPSRTRRTM